MADVTAGAPDLGEIRETAATLRRILDAVERGDMDAPVVMLAQIHGAVAALETLADHAEAEKES